jgi:hypothetical protein
MSVKKLVVNLLFVAVVVNLSVTAVAILAASNAAQL